MLADVLHDVFDRDALEMKLHDAIPMRSVRGAWFEQRLGDGMVVQHDLITNNHLPPARDIVSLGFRAYLTTEDAKSLATASFILLPASGIRAYHCWAVTCTCAACCCAFPCPFVESNTLGYQVVLTEAILLDVGVVLTCTSRLIYSIDLRCSPLEEHHANSKTQ